ncbi:MAG: HlyD family type I secretion periplasmic adaptor subunit [Magnetovibrionaceae bacterium]
MARTKTPEEKVNPGTHLFLALTVLMVGAAAAWAYYGTLEIVSTATGEVIPSSQVKTVQHLEGGIVLDIHVREGQSVKAGEPLVSLEPTASEADVGELEKRIRGLTVDVVRLEAELAEAETVIFPDDLVSQSPDLVAEAMGLFETRRARQAAQLEAQGETISQRKQEINVIRARLSKQRKSLKLLQEQVGISEELLKKDLTNRMLHLNLLKEANDLGGQIREDQASIGATEAAVKQAEARLETLRGGYREDVSRELEEKRRRLDELQTRIAKFQDTRQRTVLRSPVEGVVKTMSVVTIGGVIQPGATVAEVVPAGDRLVIEARLPSQEIGYVAEGQTASVQLASGDAARFGKLKGDVVQVSPDTIDSGEGYAYYRVLIETEKDTFERAGQQYRLVPGVEVICSIQTGNRTVLEYLMDPFLGSVQTALRER